MSTFVYHPSVGRPSPSRHRPSVPAASSAHSQVLLTGHCQWRPLLCITAQGNNFAFARIPGWDRRCHSLDSAVRIRFHLRVSRNLSYCSLSLQIQPGDRLRAILQLRQSPTDNSGCLLGSDFSSENLSCHP